MSGLSFTSAFACALDWLENSASVEQCSALYPKYAPRLYPLLLACSVDIANSSNFSTNDAETKSPNLDQLLTKASRRISAADALDCMLSARSHGCSLETCLRLFPTHAAHLRPLIEISDDVRHTVQTSLSFEEVPSIDWQMIVARNQHEDGCRFRRAAQTLGRYSQHQK